MDPENMEQVPGDKLKEDEKVTEKTPVLSGAECSIFESSTGNKIDLDSMW